MYKYSFANTTENQNSKQYRNIDFCQQQKIETFIQRTFTLKLLPLLLMLPFFF